MQIRRTTVEKTAWLPALILRPLMWLGRHEFGVLVAVAGLTGGAWLFVVVGDEIMEGGTQAIDRTWLLGIRKFGYQNPVLGLALHEWARDSFRRNSRACAADPHCYGIPVPKWEKAHGVFHMCFGRKRIVFDSAAQEHVPASSA